MDILLRLRVKVFPFFIKKILGLLRDKEFYRISFVYLHRKGKGKIYFPNIDDPSTFNEKTLFMKMYYRETPIDYFADKYRVREYITQKIGSRYLVPLINHYEKAEDIDFDKLPQEFVLKMNHGSGWNLIVLDKNKINRNSVKHQLEKWMKLNYYNVGREWQYKSIKPLILCEEFLFNPDHTPIRDYKVFCFNGKAQFVQIDLDRFTNHRRQFYDRDWNLQPFTTLFPKEDIPIEKPNHLAEVLEAAEKLAVGFMFLRVDFYYNGSEIHFGELTLHHGGGCEPFIPSEYDLILGKMLKMKRR